MRGNSARSEDRDRSGARREPFPDSLDDIYFLTPALQQSLQLIRHLLQSSRQLILITGENGSGVSALSRYLASRADEPWRTRLLSAVPASDPGDLIAQILGGRPSGSDLDDWLIKSLKNMEEQGWQPLIIVDDAERLTEPQLQLLTRLAQVRYRDGRYRVILAGHGGIQQRVACAGGPGATQGIIHLVQINPLAAAEVSTYVAYRFAACGLAGDLLEQQQCDDIAVVSGGYPARINKLARQALQPTPTRTAWYDSGFHPSGLITRMALAGIAVVIIMVLLLAIGLRDNGSDVAQTVRATPTYSPPSAVVSAPPVVETPPDTFVQSTLIVEVNNTNATSGEGKGRESTIPQSVLPGFPAILGEEWLATLSDNGYVIQLIGAHELHTIRRYLVYQPALTGNLSLVRTKRDNRAWYLLLTGPYADRESAVAGISRLPDYARQNRPWPRSTAAVREEAKAAPIE